MPTPDIPAALKLLLNPPPPDATYVLTVTAHLLIPGFTYTGMTGRPKKPQRHGPRNKS